MYVFEDLYVVVKKILTNKMILIEDLNGHRVRNKEYNKVHEGYNFRTRIEEEIIILDLIIAYEFIISNMFFKKSEEHVVTFKSGNNVVNYLSYD